MSDDLKERLQKHDWRHLTARIEQLEAQLAAAREALEQAQDCIRGETPEDMSDEDAREDTIKKIRAALATAPATDGEKT